jgi:hypothetical protein
MPRALRSPLSPAPGTKVPQSPRHGLGMIGAGAAAPTETSRLPGPAAGVLTGREMACGPRRDRAGIVSTSSGEDALRWVARRGTFFATTMFQRQTHCWERPNIVGKLNTLLGAPNTLLGALQHCWDAPNNVFWPRNNVGTLPTLFLELSQCVSVSEAVAAVPAVRWEVFQCGGASFNGKAHRTKDTEVFSLKN